MTAVQTSPSPAPRAAMASASSGPRVGRRAALLGLPTGLLLGLLLL